MDENRYYSGAKQDLYDYIKLLEKTGARTAEESDKKKFYMKNWEKEVWFLIV